MTKRDRQAWMIVVSMFLALVVIVGASFDTLGVFLTPLSQHFGWSRAQISTFQSAVAIAAGIVGPLVGWLLDRVETRIVVIAGAIIASIGFLIASRANSYATLLSCYVLVGIGMGAAGFIPGSMLVANWFGERRGLAMSIVIAGASFGAAVMTTLSTFAIAYAGWRFGYFVLALPMLFIVIPMAIVFVRTRPEGTDGQQVSAAQAASVLPGLELSEALHSRSFWMICAMQFIAAFVIVSLIEHLIPYFIGLGYSRKAAAGMMSANFMLAACMPPIGLLADRLTARLALAADFFFLAVAMGLALAARNEWIMVVFITVAGLSGGGTLVLLPLLIVDSLGLKRFGSIFGLAQIFNMLGGALGPVFTGGIFDKTGAYALSFEIFVVTSLVGVFAALACRPLNASQSAVRKPAALSASGA